jgi:hypothetical protein
MPDPDHVRLVALAAQKLTCDIVTEARARAYGREKGAEKRKAAGGDGDKAKKPKLTTKDLEGSLLKVGVISDVPPCLAPGSSE